MGIDDLNEAIIEVYIYRGVASEHQTTLNLYIMHEQHVTHVHTEA